MLSMPRLDDLQKEIEQLQEEIHDLEPDASFDKIFEYIGDLFKEQIKYEGDLPQEGLVIRLLTDYMEEWIDEITSTSQQREEWHWDDEKYSVVVESF